MASGEGYERWINEYAVFMVERDDLAGKEIKRLKEGVRETRELRRQGDFGVEKSRIKAM